MARREPLDNRNILQDSTKDFSEKIEEYMRTRRRAASMTSLFGSSGNIEQEEVKSVRPRTSTFSQKLVQRPRTALKDKKLGIHEAFKEEESMKIELTKTKEKNRKSTYEKTNLMRFILNFFKIK